MVNKKNYISPEIEVMLIDEDIITASGVLFSSFDDSGKQNLSGVSISGDNDN